MGALIQRVEEVMGRRGVAALALVSMLALAGCGGVQQASASSPTPSPSPSPTPTKRSVGDVIQANLKTCGIPDRALTTGLIVFGDDNHTVQVRSDPGSEPIVDGRQAICALQMVGLPVYVKDQILQTRALDGMQHAAWGDGIKATWTYHPDDGLNVTVTDR